ncbi:MAG: glutamine--fructose-6-phosphate transaminase (isomerizing) [Chromatiales bacterium]|jgi:glutamine---fructose-6-phosphate transaminase (isomerizing)|nr:glutamine--fructose-6-phosphate transaminase (isomerizing) [Chromatiales bacterium]
MCGIVGAVAQRDVVPILMEGLRRLEYRGYDSAGLAVLSGDANIGRLRTPGKVAQLQTLLDAEPKQASVGIAHTRWATHGKPTQANAHPHVSCDHVALVHNGIIENHAALRAQQVELGYIHESETDTEVIAHQIHRYINGGAELLSAVQSTIAELRGAFALGVVSKTDLNRVIGARSGSPLVVGVGVGEHFIASDVAALIPVTQQFVFLEEGDLVDINGGSMQVYDAAGVPVERPVVTSDLSADAVDRGTYRHYMLKEIHEQPKAIADTIEGRLGDGHVLDAAFGPEAMEQFSRVESIQIVACGTSYHAGLVARHWLEGLARIPTSVEVASEFRYRDPVVRPNTLMVTISQSGETADTLAALRGGRDQGFATSLGIVNVPESSLVRESDLVLMTRAGPEIGVASTKAFTTQLTALLMLAGALGARRGMDKALQAQLVDEVTRLPAWCEEVLTLDAEIKRLSERFADKRHALFLGRGLQHPVAMEGALKLKEISYIHAEAYPAGELKHGPLALVDAEMPVIAVAPNDALLEKLESNLEEVKARGGELYIFADPDASMAHQDNVHVIEMPRVGSIVAPILYTLPLQLLSYHVAVLKGTDVDQPRNLAKSVTVE